METPSRAIIPCWLAALLCLGLAASAQAGVLSFSWEAPTTKTDGEDLTDLAGYRVYLGSTPGQCGSASFQPVTAALPAPAPGTVVTHQMSGLTAGTTYFVAVAAVNLAGTVGACSNEASGTAQSELAVSPAGTVNFGSIPVGSAVDHTVTVTNNNATSNVAVSLSVSAPFSVASPGTSFTVKAGGSTAVVIRFSPTVVGSVTQTLTVSSSAGGVSRTLTGTGEVAMDVTPAGPVDFGSVAVGISADRTFTVTNGGSTSLPVSASVGAPFHVVSPGGSFTVPAGGSTPVVVRFSPTVGGAVTHTLAFNSTAGSASRPVSGTGLVAPSVTPAEPVDFGGVAVGGSAEQTFTVTNSGPTNLAVVVSVSDPFSVVSPGTTFSVGGGESVAVVVRFSPPAAGSVTQALLFGSDAGTVSRAVTGTGLAAPSITPEGPVDFGTVEVGSSVDQAFTLTNSGATALTVSASVAAPFTIVSPGIPFTTGAGSSTAVVVRFSPTVEGGYTEGLGFTSGAGDVNVTLSGSATKAKKNGPQKPSEPPGRTKPR